MHLSVHSSASAPSPTTTQSRRLDGPLAPSLTPIERSFLQGILSHLPALCALTLPTPASYARVLDGIWSGGTYVCWGRDNREAPVRLCGSGGKGGGGHHFELKSSDATSNPYIALAGIVGVGARAIAKGEQLKTGNCTKPVALMSEEERVSAGVNGVERLPNSAAEARGNLKKDDVVRDVLGAEFVGAYLAVNEVSLPGSQRQV